MPLVLFNHEVAMNPTASQGAQSRPRQRQRQPLEVANHPDAQLMLETVVALTGRSSSTLYRLMAADQFVQPLRHGKRCTRWRAGDVMDWLRKQAATQGAAQ